MKDPVVMKKHSNVRDLNGVWRHFVRVVAIGMSLFQLYSARFTILPAFYLRSIHFAFVIVMVFIIFGGNNRSKKVNIIDIGFILLGLVSMGYIALNYSSIMIRVLFIHQADLLRILLALAAVIVTLEVTRRTLGPIMPLLAVGFILYGFFGRYMLGRLYHSGVSISRMVDQLYLSFEGIFGIALGVSATYIFVFLLFGSFLEKTGTGKFFIELSNAIAGATRGGPAKIAIFASAFMGTISGSSSANAVTTGSFTIPMMRDTGYDKTFSASVEAVSSIGGQIMPPIMGAGAFIMAEYLGITYFQVAYHAIVPAIMYFLAVFMMVHFEALKLDLKAIQKEKRLNFKKVLKEGYYLFIPVIVIIYYLVSGYTPARAGFNAILATIVVSFFKKSTRMNLVKLVDALERGARNSIPVVTACACAGIVIGIIRATGLGLKFGSLIISASMGNYLIALILTALAGIILGMGLPTAPSYIIQASLAAPALIKLGLAPIAAHLFVFYYAILSSITPPVAITCYAVSPLAQANPVKVGYKAFRLGIAAYLIPFVFAYDTKLILIDVSYSTIITIITALIGVIALAGAVQEWFLVKTLLWHRIVLAIVAIILIIPGTLTDIIGIMLLGTVYISQLKKYREEKDIVKGKDLG